MPENKPKITASSVESFNIISEAIAKLPPKVFEQIERVEGGLVGFNCYISKSYDETPKIYLPKDTRQISYFEDYIGVYCGEFFFKLPDIKAKYTYLFI